MTQINWGIAAGPSAFDNALAKGVQMGQMVRQQRDETEHRNALLQQRQQELDARLATQQAQMTEKQDARKQADAGTMRKLLVHAKTNPQQALQAAQGMGIDVSRIPPPDSPDFQPWVDQQLFIAEAIDRPEGQEALSTAGKIAADMGLRPGTPEHANATREIFLADAAKPYTGGQGETRLYIPQLSGGKPVAPQPGTVVGGFTFKGGNPNDRNAWEPVGQGGPTQPASGGFRP